jgi:hypothetical protein
MALAIRLLHNGRMSDGPQQAEAWEKFYELAWRFRHSELAEFIEKQGLNPYQAIRKLERLEMHHSLTQTPIGTYLQKIDFKLHPKFLLPTGMPILKNAQILEQEVPTPIYADPVDLILDWLSMNPVKAIVELGAGYGQNIIKMLHRYGPLGAQVYAGEYTQSGRDLATYLLSKIPDANVKVFAVDHKAPDLSVVEESDNVLLISIHSIEQVTQIGSDYFEQLTKNFNRVHGMFFEPFGFQLRNSNAPQGEVSKKHEESAREKGWNLNLGPVALAAQAEGIIKIRSLFKNIMPGDNLNPTSFMYWTRNVD